MVVEAFKAYQAEEVSALIRRDLLEIIAKEYPADYLDSLLEHFTPANIRATAKKQQIFVAIDDGKIIGTASLANFGSQNEPRYYGTAVFVLPESQGKGVGKQLMDQVEAKAREWGAVIIVVRAAVGARGFYGKLGYGYQSPEELPDEKGNYVMEKRLCDPSK